MINRPSTRHVVPLACICLLTFFLFACDRAPSPASTAVSSAASQPRDPLPVDQERLQTADADNANWMSVGRTYSEQRFSPLKQISASNVGQLQLAWHYDLEAPQRSQQSTPLVIDGVMYVTTAWSKVFAFDAATGELAGCTTLKCPVSGASTRAVILRIAESPHGRAASSSAHSMAGSSRSTRVRGSPHGRH